MNRKGAKQMSKTEWESPEMWAVKTFGEAELGDPRRTDRLVSIAAALAHNPGASLPAAMRHLSATRAAYRFFDNPAITHEQILAPTFARTRLLASQRPRVLLAADTTEINLTTHTTTSGRGPIGQGISGEGFYLYTVLALDAENKQLLGCAYQEPFVRQPAPEKETRAQRRERARETQIWERSAQRIGQAPAEAQWVYVADRGADIYTFWQTCRSLGCDVLVRVYQERKMVAEQEGERTDPVGEHLHELAQRLPSQGARVLHVKAEHPRPAREAFVQIAFQEVRLQPPAQKEYREKAEMQAWLIRVWEPEPPEGVEALEWLLITTVAVKQQQEAWERAEWYNWRWMMEDFHQVLKTGCQIEHRYLRNVEALFRLLGLLTPTALRLLVLREVAQESSEREATQVVSPLMVRVVSWLTEGSKEHLSARDLWRLVASLGGYMNRPSDPPPGWKTLWRGWLYLQTVLEGVAFALAFSP
jgi:hypothetical protein